MTSLTSVSRVAFLQFCCSWIHIPMRTADSCDVTDICVTCWVLPFCCSWIHNPLILLFKENSWLMWRHWQLNSPLCCSSIFLLGVQLTYRTSLTAILYVTCWTSLFLDSHISCSFSRRTADSLFDFTEAKPRKAVYRSNITRKRYALRMSFPTWTSLVWFGLVWFQVDVTPLSQLSSSLRWDHQFDPNLKKSTIGVINTI